MKKWLYVTLSLLVIVGLLAACSGGKNRGGNDVKIPDGATEIVMWNLFGGGDAEYMKNIVDKFNESQSDYFVNNIMQEHGEYYTKLLTSIGAGKGPDFGIAHTYVLPELINEGLITELDTLGEEVGVNWDEFNQNVLDATIFDGSHYAVPLDTHAQIMYVNNKLVGDAGLLNADGTLKMEQTPEGFIEFFQTLKEKLPEGKIPFSFSNAGADPYWTWWTYYTQLGGRGILTEDSLDKPTWDLNLEAATEAAEFVKSLYHEHEIIPLNIADFYGEFGAGNAAVMSTGVWATGIWETTEGLDFTPMPIPPIFGKDAAWAASHTFIIPHNEKLDEKYKKGALEFMKFAAENGAMWAQAGHIPANDTVIQSQEFKDLPYRSEYAEVANYVNFADSNIYARGVETIVIRHLDSIWANDVSVSEAFKNMEKEVKELISK